MQKEYVKVKSWLKCDLLQEVLLVIPSNVAPFMFSFLLNTCHQQKLSYLYFSPYFFSLWNCTGSSLGLRLDMSWPLLYPQQLELSFSTTATGHMCLLSSYNMAAGIEMCCECNTHWIYIYIYIMYLFLIALDLCCYARGFL